MKQEVYVDSKDFKPRNDYVLVQAKQLETEKKTESGIIYQVGRQSSLERPTSGEVVAIGADSTDIDIGDFVFWPMQDGIDYQFNDGDFVLLRNKSIIGTKR